MLTRVKPLRDQNRRESIKKLWWRFAWERPVLREAIKSQRQYFVTLETSKHRFFGAIPGNCLWDGSLFAIASEDFYVGGVLGTVVYTQLIHDSGPKESQAMAKSVIRWIPTHMGCGPGEGSLRRLL